MPRLCRQVFWQRLIAVSVTSVGQVSGEISDKECCHDPSAWELGKGLTALCRKECHLCDLSIGSNYGEEPKWSGPELDTTDRTNTDSAVLHYCGVPQCICVLF